MNTIRMLQASADHGGAYQPAQARGRLLKFVSGAKLAERMLRLQPVVRPVGMHRVVAEAMTIKETSFFRDAAVFKVLMERVLPDLIERNRRKRTLRLWSAGCATGQETYSLAMLLCEQFPELESWDVQIIGTDISRQACAYARRGRYTRFEVNRGLPIRYMLKYFSRTDEAWSVCDSVRRMVRFRCADLCKPTSQTYDLILLRYVLFSLPPAERVRVLAGAYISMRSNAHMVLGSSEQVEEAFGLFEHEMLKDHCFYRPVSTGRN